MSLAALVAILGGAGVLHMLLPKPYQKIVPAPLAPWRAEVVTVSGLAELACATALLIPRTRRVGALATAALLVAVFPANIQMALDAGSPFSGFPALGPLVAWARLPLQVPLVWWALRFRHRPRQSL